MAPHFVPYDQTISIPNVIVDGTANNGTVLTLSHWRRSGTPEELMADTSAEIVFKYLDAPRFHVAAEAVSNNHFDEDGLIGVFAFAQSRIALRHRELLIDAAQAGDFGVYKDRNAARIAFVISSYADPETSPLPKSIFQLRYPELAAELYREVLVVMPALLEDIHAYRAMWEEEDRKLTESEKLIGGGIVTIEERPELDLAIVRIPDTIDASRVHRFTQSRAVECHPFAIHNQTTRSRLLLIKGGDVEFQYRYESWVRMASRRPALRIDLTSLAEELNREEGDARWIFEGVDRIVPRLYRKGTRQGGIAAGRVIEFLERALRTNVAAWNPYD
jgi:hypothetical protein